MPMQYNIPVRQMLDFNNQYVELNRSLIGFLNRSKLQDFWNHNKIRIEGLIAKSKQLMELQAKLVEKCYLVVDGKIITEGEGENAKNVLTGVMTEEEFQRDVTQLQKEYNEWLDSKTVVVI